MNRNIKYLILSDITILTWFGLITPILAIFIKEDILGWTIFAAGLASTLFLISKSLIQLPFSRYVDTHDNKKRLLLIGSFLVVVVPFLYLIASDIRHIYLIQIFYGIGSGITYPTRLGIRSISLDKRKESFERSLYSTAISIGTAITAAVWWALAQYAWFNVLFISIGVFSLIWTLILFKIRNK